MVKSLLLFVAFKILQKKRKLIYFYQDNIVFYFNICELPLCYHACVGVSIGEVWTGIQSYWILHNVSKNKNYAI
jgi:hypothetical protein